MNRSKTNFVQLNNEQRALLELINCACQNSNSPSCACCLESVDWNELMRLASKLNILELVYPGLLNIQNNQKSLSDFISYNEFCLFSEIHHNLPLTNKSMPILKKIKAHFHTSQIPLVLFKSTVTNSLYPNPELNYVSEYELYIKRENYATANLLIASLGYTALTPANPDSPFQVFSHSDYPSIKLYWRLTPDKSSYSDSDRFEEILWSRAFSPDDESRYIQHLSNEDHFLVLLSELKNTVDDTHMNFRSLIDLMIFSRHYMPKMDMIKVNYLVREFELAAFYETMAMVSKKYFYNAWPSIDSATNPEHAEVLISALFNAETSISDNGHKNFSNWFKTFKTNIHYTKK